MYTNTQLQCHSVHQHLKRKTEDVSQLFSRLWENKTAVKISLIDRVAGIVWAQE